MEKVLVTGATGFVGSHLVRHLAEKGYKVRGVSRKEVSPFTEKSPCHPVDSYGISKREAEELVLSYFVI